jgi:ubiquinone/menaquinone biosynthesis C-methylase UbiE
VKQFQFYLQANRLEVAITIASGFESETTRRATEQVLMAALVKLEVENLHLQINVVDAIMRTGGGAKQKLVATMTSPDPSSTSGYQNVVGGGATMEKREEPESSTSQELFTQEWQVYRKMVDNDYLFHAGAYRSLRQFLIEEMDRPFLFLDIACGDASMSVKALEGTKVAGYHGIDISKQALDIAERNLAALGCPIELEQRNFVEALSTRQKKLDVVWIGLSLHHLRGPGKLEVMQRVRELMHGDGCLLVYENASPDGESREKWLERWDAQKSTWTAYIPAEWDYVTAHVHAADFPETEADWHNLGTQAGFRSTETVFISPSSLFRLYVFRC